MLISILIVFMQTLDSEIDHFKFEYTLYSHYVCNYYLVTFEFGGGRVVRRCWVNFQCRGALLIWIIVGQGPTALAVGAGGGCFDNFTLIYPFFPLSPSLWETARYRLKYCLKGPLNPKSTNQPTFEFPSHHFFLDRAAGSFYHMSFHVVTSFLVVLWTDARLWLSWRSHKFNAIAIVFAFCYLLECLFL